MSMDALWSGLGVAPQVTSAEALSSRRVRVHFDEPLQADADPANYTINALDIDSAARTVVSVLVPPTPGGPTYVDLELDGDLTVGVLNYEVVVSTTVADAAGNTLDPAHDTAEFDGLHTTIEIDHCELGKDRLALQFKDKAKIEAVVCALGDQVTELEQAAADVLAFRPLEDAVGEQLDGRGQLLVLPRNGLEDAEYRRQLRAMREVIGGGGSPEDLLSVLTALDDGFSEAIGLEESYPAAIEMRCQVPAGEQDRGVEFARRFLIPSKPAGVKLILNFAETETPLFGWAGQEPLGAVGWSGDNPGGGSWSRSIGSGRREDIVHG